MPILLLIYYFLAGESSTTLRCYWNLELCIFVFLFFSGGFKVLFIALVQSFSHYSNVAQKLVRIGHISFFCLDIEATGLIKSWGSDSQSQSSIFWKNVLIMIPIIFIFFFIFIILVLYWAFLLHVHLATASQCLTQWLCVNPFIPKMLVVILPSVSHLILII